MADTTQLSLFDDDSPVALLPEGVDYFPEAITRVEERSAIEVMSGLELKPFFFQGFEGKRRVASFGWRYDFSGGGLQKAGDIPDFLLPMRERAADVAGISPKKLEHVLVTEYKPGAGIGWHRDRPQFGKVVAVSLGAPCRLRFRHRSEAGWQRLSRVLAPRSIYVLDGPGRNDWEHSIPAVEELRYSLTFRTMR
jgi:alkylated DNA repair dioxygenase AlkB